jgi:dihydropteroate synthase
MSSLQTPRRWTTNGATQLMGVLNVTPDSFSDGGRFVAVEAAVAHGIDLARQGAAVVDVGGESTRPGYTPVPAAEQVRRTVPVLAALRARTSALLSIDTTRAEVARAALAAGADLVNDTSALADDDELAEVVAAAGCQVVLMHRFTPARSVHDDRDPVTAVLETLSRRIEHAARRGIGRGKIVVDPGLGFGSRADDVPVLIARIDELRQLDCPLLVGPSRKSFLQAFTGRAVGAREFGTAAAVAALALAGVECVRVHDVAAMRDVVQVAAAIRAGGRNRCPG